MWFHSRHPGSSFTELCTFHSFPVPCTCTVLAIATVVPQIFNYRHGSHWAAVDDFCEGSRSSPGPSYRGREVHHLPPPEPLCGSPTRECSLNTRNHGTVTGQSPLSYGKISIYLFIYLLIVLCKNCMYLFIYLLYVFIVCIYCCTHYTFYHTIVLVFKKIMYL